MEIPNKDDFATMPPGERSQRGALLLAQLMRTDVDNCPDTVINSALELSTTTIIDAVSVADHSNPTSPESTMNMAVTAALLVANKTIASLLTRLALLEGAMMDVSSKVFPGIDRVVMDPAVQGALKAGASDEELQAVLDKIGAQVSDPLGR